MTPGFLTLATSQGVPRRSLVTALVVGSILTAINQGDVILAGLTPNFHKMALNFFVLFCVATYGAVSMKRAMLKRSGGAAEGC